ncbi:MAG: hypothetical protein WC222_04140 [Parachlamydiales bacterium]|jgi:hypothetical protein
MTPLSYSRQDLVTAFNVGTVNSKNFNELIKDEKFCSHEELYSVAKEIIQDGSNLNSMVRAYAVLTSKNITSLPSLFHLREQYSLYSAISKCENVFSMQFEEFYPLHKAISPNNDVEVKEDEPVFLTQYHSIEKKIGELPENEKSQLLSDFDQVKKHLMHDDVPSAKAAWDKVLSDCLYYDQTGNLKSPQDAETFLLTGYYPKVAPLNENDFEELIVEEPPVRSSAAIEPVDIPVESSSLVIAATGVVNLKQINTTLQQNAESVETIYGAALRTDSQELQEFSANIVKCPQLKKIILEFKTLNEEQAEILSSSFKSLQNLNTLSLTEVKDEKALKVIIEHLKEIPNLKELSLNDCNIDNITAETLSSSFKSLHNLNTLSLAGVKDVKVLRVIVEHVEELPNLKQFSLQDCNIDTDLQSLLKLKKFMMFMGLKNTDLE